LVVKFEVEVRVGRRAVDGGAQPGQGLGGGLAIDPDRQRPGGGERGDRVAGAGAARGVGQLLGIDRDRELAPGQRALAAGRGDDHAAVEGAVDRGGERGVGAVGGRGRGLGGGAGARRGALAGDDVAADQRSAHGEEAGGEAEIDRAAAAIRRTTDHGTSLSQATPWAGVLPEVLQRADQIARPVSPQAWNRSAAPIPRSPRQV
jgi:hypothetical protein